MPVKTEASGRRSIQVEVEVPGTPEEVWQAIATGPGISSWFVPTELDGRPGGTVTCSFGPGMDSSSTITDWKPPHHFVAEHEVGPSAPNGPNAPKMATEWIVESRAGGLCTVRVVHSFFATTDDWDNQLTGVESGWPTFFRILKFYLANFRGLPGTCFCVTEMTAEAGGWERLTTALGVSSLEGRPWKTPSGVPNASGTTEWAGGAMPSILVRLEKPMPGVAFVSSCKMGSTEMLSTYFYLYGNGAKAVADREEPLWRAWLKQLFPAAG